jgi:hypothetical protein
MQFLHRQLLNLRVWLIRCQLRQTGFRKFADEASAETILRLKLKPPYETTRTFRRLKILLTIEMFLVLWLHFRLHPPELIPIAVPPFEKPSSSPSLPDAIVPLHRNFGEPTLHLHTA